MKQAIELREERAKLIHDNRQLLELAETEKRELTDEESGRWDERLEKAEELRAQYERIEKLEKAEAELEDTQGRAMPPVQPTETLERSDPAEDVEKRHSEVFSRYLQHGQRGLSRGDLEFLEQRALQADSPAAGGYMVADQQFVADVINIINDQVYVRQLATVLTVNSAQTLGVPTLEAEPEDGTWSAEIATVDEDTAMTLGKRELSPQLCAKLLKVSRKLLMQSSIPAEALVRDRLAYKMAITQETAFLTGTGANQPLGVFTASANGISTGRDVSTDNTSTAVTLDGLKNAKYSVKSNFWSGAVWLGHRDLVKQIDKIKDGDGTYIWSASVQTAQPDQLMGHPFYMSEKAPSTFTASLYVGIFGHFGLGYWIADYPGGTSIDRADEIYRPNSQVGFFAEFYSDGMPVNENAFARVKLGA